jgi:radical SAM protein (TIGR04043 family)
MKIAEKKIELQSKGVRISWELERRLIYDFPTATSDYMSFMIGEVPVAMLNGHYTSSSPYEIKEMDGRYGIYKGDTFFTEIEFLKRPKFFDKHTSDGVKMEKLGKLVAPGFLIVYLSTGCIYWGERQCKFCVTGYIDTPKNKKPEWIAELAENAAGEIRSHIALTCGALPKDLGNKLLADTAEAIKERADIPISVNGEPPRDIKWIDKMTAADSIYINLEVYDETARAKFLPGKSEFKIGYYDEVFKRCLDVFDENQVGSVLLVGLEEDSTYLRGVEHLARLGVIPVPIPVYPTFLSKLSDQQPPNARRMKEIYLRTADIIKDYGLDPFKTTAGFIKGGALTALKEVMRNV